MSVEDHLDTTIFSRFLENQKVDEKQAREIQGGIQTMKAPSDSDEP